MMWRAFYRGKGSTETVDEEDPVIWKHNRNYAGPKIGKCGVWAEQSSVAGETGWLERKAEPCRALPVTESHWETSVGRVLLLR